MSGTSIISGKEEDVLNCNHKSDSPANNQTNGKLNGDRNSNKSPTTIKENKDFVCFCNGASCDGASRQAIDESQLLELMLTMKQKLKLAGERLYETTSNEWEQYYSFPRLFLANSPGENQLIFVLQPSLFHRSNVPPTIYFSTNLNEHSRPPVGLPKSLQSLFRWRISSITPNSIRNCVSFMKFDTIRPSNTTDLYYLGTWCKHMLTAEFGQLDEWRKVNHYPGSFHLGRKDKLWVRLRLAEQKFGRDEFNNFHPTTFVLPRDYDALNDYWKQSPSKLFIMKPPASARGNGIRVINHISQIPESALVLPTSDAGVPTKKSTVIVQRYISNPCLLENGQKFDLRVYVLLASVDPLRVYVYDEGLVRFASTKYTSQEDGIIDQYMHLTNYFVNKNSQKYQVNNDCESSNGSKWSLKRFWRYLNDHHKHVDTEKLWKDIVDIIVKTVICCEGPITRLSRQNCKNDYTSYELFGFDIILDEKFKPWILEVNITPSLKSESDLDTSVKYRVIKDMFNLVGYNLPPPMCTEQVGALAGSKIFFDRRLYTQNLTKQEKIKHSRYQRLFKCDQDRRPRTSNLIEDSSAHGNPHSRERNEELPNGKTSTNEPISNGHETRDQTISHNPVSQGEQSDSDSTGITSDSILDDLTQDDARVLMLAEDELSRCGSFMRAFPSATSSSYLKYFDKPRYYDLLMDAWERQYGHDRAEGIRRLTQVASFLE